MAACEQGAPNICLLQNLADHLAIAVKHVHISCGHAALLKQPHKLLCHQRHSAGTRGLFEFDSVVAELGGGKGRAGSRRSTLPGTQEGSYKATTSDMLHAVNAKLVAHLAPVHHGHPSLLWPHLQCRVLGASPPVCCVPDAAANAHYVLTCCTATQQCFDAPCDCSVAQPPSTAPALMQNSLQVMHCQ